MKIMSNKKFCPKQKSQKKNGKNRKKRTSYYRGQ